MQKALTLSNSLLGPTANNDHRESHFTARDNKMRFSKLENIQIVIFSKAIRELFWIV